MKTIFIKIINIYERSKNVKLSNFLDSINNLSYNSYIKANLTREWQITIRRLKFGSKKYCIIINQFRYFFLTMSKEVYSCLICDPIASKMNKLLIILIVLFIVKFINIIEIGLAINSTTLFLNYHLFAHGRRPALQQLSKDKRRQTSVATCQPI